MGFAHHSQRVKPIPIKIPLIFGTHHRHSGGGIGPGSQPHCDHLCTRLSSYSPGSIYAASGCRLVKTRVVESLVFVRVLIAKQSLAKTNICV